MPVFRPLGPDHWLILVATGAVALGLLRNATRLRRIGHDRAVRVVLALGLLGNELVSWGYALAQGRWGLPLQLCDLAILVMAWALLGRSQLAKELAVCWALAGSLQAVLTPDLREGFPSYPWLQFFLGHCGIVLSAVYLLVTGRAKLTAASVWRVWGLSNLYVALAMLLNWCLGTNFGYLARKPEHPSLLDYLGPWPLYIGWIELIGLTLFFLCYGLSRSVERRTAP